MKRLLCIVLCIFLVGCSEAAVAPGFNDIDGDEVVSKVMNKETFVLMISAEKCDPCEEFVAESASLIEMNQLVVYRVYYSKLSEDTENQFQLIFKEFKSWPVIIYVQDGEVRESTQYEYSQDPEGWKEWFQSQNLIKTN